MFPAVERDCLKGCWLKRVARGQQHGSGIWNPWLVTLKPWLVTVPSWPFVLPVIRLCALINTQPPPPPDQLKLGFVSCNPKTPDKHMLGLLLAENHEEARDHSVSLPSVFEV